MRNFVKRALEKIEKLDINQIRKMFISLAAENEMLETVLNSMTDGVVVIDKQHKILFANKSSRRLLPFAPQDHSEKILWEVITDKEISRFFCTTLRAHEKITDAQFTLGNSSARMISCSIMPLVNKGKIQGNLIHIEDITEKKSREARLRRAESLASLTSLTAAVAHEIKNPLGSIGIHIQLLKKMLEANNSVNTEEANKYIDIIKEEMERLNRVVVDFLFAVHPMNAEFELGDLNQVLADLLNFLKYELEQAGISLNTTFNDLPQIEMDEKFIKQALLNIIKNAIAAMPDGGALSVKTKVAGDFVQLIISDTGTGIPENIINKIFEPYFTTKEFGSGIGLTIVYKIIKEHLGDISVDSREKEGTSFTISLPIPQKEKRLLSYKGDTCEIYDNGS